jgi:hypothetical protein
MFISGELGCDIFIKREILRTPVRVIDDISSWMLSSLKLLNPAVHVSWKVDSFVGLFLLFQTFDTKINTM